MVSIGWGNCPYHKDCMALLHEMFPGCLISQLGDVPWPAHSPNLLVPDFFLWGYDTPNMSGH